MTRYVRLPTYAYTIVLGVCRAYEVWCGRASVPDIGREMVDAVEVAAARVMRGEERAIPLMIRAIARRTPYSHSPPELMMSYSEATFNRRKNRLINAIAKELGII